MNRIQKNILYFNSLLIVLLFLVACDAESIQNSMTEHYQDKVENCIVVTRDGCEYLVFYSGREGHFSHKGDCNNPIHTCK